MLGLRFYTNDRHPQSWFTDGTLDWLWPAAERAGVPVSLGAAMFLPTVDQIAERHPGLKLAVDHMGVPRASKGEAAYRFQPELLALAKHPNVAVKATGQAGYAEDEYPFRSLHPHLHRCFDAFGPERMFWGTDITRMHCTWRQCVTLFTEELPWLKGRDLDLVMGEALCNGSAGRFRPKAEAMDRRHMHAAALQPGSSVGVLKTCPGPTRRLESHFDRMDQTARARFRGPGDGCRLPQAAFIRGRRGNSCRHE